MAGEVEAQPVCSVAPMPLGALPNREAFGAKRPLSDLALPPRARVPLVAQIHTSFAAKRRPKPSRTATPLTAFGAPEEDDRQYNGVGGEMRNAREAQQAIGRKRK